MVYGRSTRARKTISAGPDLPRWLDHESSALLAASLIQLSAGARLADEWAGGARLLGGWKPPPSQPCGPAMRGPLPASPSRRGELVERLARFWDMSTRGAHRLVKEEGDTLDGRLQEIEIERGQRGHDEQSGWEADAIMSGGRDRGIQHGAPYVWMKEHARSSSRLSSLGEAAVVWAVALFLPIARNVALNTRDRRLAPSSPPSIGACH